MLLTKYYNRDIVHSFIVVIVILLTIIVINMFVHYLEYAAGGNITGGTVFKLLGSLIPKYLTTLIPVAFFFAIVMSYGKMFSNNELSIAFACGLNWIDLLKMIIRPTILVIILESFLSFIAVPTMTQNLNIIKKTASQSSIVDFIQPGKIMNFDNGNKVLYTEKVDKNNIMYNVFIYQKSNKSNKFLIITAPEAESLNDNGNKYLVLKNGYFYQGIIGQKNYQKAKFKEATQFLQGKYLPYVNEEIEGKSISELMKIGSNKAYAEIQWRFSSPISVFVAMLMAVALCYIRPRQNRYVKLVPAIIVFLVYFNLISLSKNWIENGSIPPFIGVWWVHILFTTLALIVIKKRNGPIFMKGEKN